MMMAEKKMNRKGRKVLFIFIIIGAVLLGLILYNADGFNLIKNTYRRVIHRETVKNTIREEKGGKTYSVAVPDNFAELTKLVGPTVVNIRTVKTVKRGNAFRQFRESPFDKEDPFYDFFDHFFGRDRQRNFKQRSLGSGFIIDKAGYIITNNHVVEDTDEISVILKNEEVFDAKIVGRDINTDLALIKIEPGKDLPVAQIGDSEKLKVGEWVMAIGSPFGLTHTVTAGIVSAKGRIIGSGLYDDFIQTDASINPGNSGGPLINMKGEVVGINTMIIAGGHGIGFAIPINLAKGIVDQLKEYGDVTRGWLGITVQDLPEELADYFGIEDKEGALVTDVIEGDPADEAGIQKKDIIIKVDGKPIESSRSLLRKIAAMDVGEVVEIKMLREGKTKTFSVKIGKRPDSKKVSEKEPPDETEKGLGITVSNLDSEIMERLNLTEKRGVIVTGVEHKSNAEKAGIQMYDIINEINHQEINTVDEFELAMKSIKPGETVQLFLRRINQGFILVKTVK